MTTELGKLNEFIRANASFPFTELEEEKEPEDKTVRFDDKSLCNIEVQEKYAPILDKVECCLIDLEGTLYDIQYNKIETTISAVDALNALKTSNIKYLLVANSWLKSKRRLLRMLKKLGFEVGTENVFTSSDCCKLYLQKHNLQNPFLLTSDDLLEDFANMESIEPDFDCVVLGLPCSMIDYRLMTKTLHLLQRGKPLLVLHAAKKVKTLGSSTMFGPGPYSQILQYATDAKRSFTAKPTTGFYLQACDYIGVQPDKCLMIGDEIADDIRNAANICMRTALVKTGSYKTNDEKKFCRLRPHILAENFATVVQILMTVNYPIPEVIEEDAVTKYMRKKGDEKHEDLLKRLKAYAVADCEDKAMTRSCNPPKMPSIIW